MKYLIAGLGNIGEKYENTRHNIGFKILDALAKASNISFDDRRYGFVAHHKHKARTYVLLKPSTYMNLSGKAVSYWMKKEKIPLERLLVVVDDVSLPFGSLRIRPKGGDAGHNGLASVNQVLGTSQYARLRFGIGNGFPKGAQVNYVLGEWSNEESEKLDELIDHALEMIRSFGTVGLELTMTRYNKK